MATSKKNTPREPIIDDGNWRKHFAPVIDGQPKGHGLVPRDFHIYPREMFAPPTEIQLIPRSEWSARIKEQEKRESRVSDIMKAANVPCLDQGQVGYCWAHSSTGCVMAVRAINGQPTVPLSAYAVAATIKKGADEGGWCGLSAKFIEDRGVPSQQLWPQGDRNYRQRDKPETWANAALHKVTENWTDATRDIYDQNLAFEMIASLLLANEPCPIDLNWWSHSVLACDLVETEADAFGIRIRNSWSASWGEQGFGILQGQKAIPDSAVCLRVSSASPN